eukprot:gb/GFBE01048335.1/.p1 GENE.gb/GFBE01048335.1/~~gb/GFBE01048335.1/.p1  ORF type:complete len:194 (+),score=19.16 gb/GFBE01048335.1/:1-582(+)
MPPRSAAKAKATAANRLMSPSPSSGPMESSPLLRRRKRTAPDSPAAIPAMPPVSGDAGSERTEGGASGSGAAKSGLLNIPRVPGIGVVGHSKPSPVKKPRRRKGVDQWVAPKVKGSRGRPKKKKKEPELLPEPISDEEAVEAMFAAANRDGRGRTVRPRRVIRRPQIPWSEYLVFVDKLGRIVLHDPRDEWRG